MLFISFGKRSPRKRPGFGSKRKGPFLHKFFGSATAKTFIDKINEANRKLAELDKKNLHPESNTYQAELKKWCKQKYLGLIGGWEGALQFLEESKAPGNEIEYAKRNLANNRREWKKVQGELK